MSYTAVNRHIPYVRQQSRAAVPSLQPQDRYQLIPVGSIRHLGAIAMHLQKICMLAGSANSGFRNLRSLGDSHVGICITIGHKSAKRGHVGSRVGDAAMPAHMADLEEGEIEEGELSTEEPEVITSCMLTLVS